MNPTITLPCQDKLDAIRKKYGLTLLIMHGSHVRGRVHSKSDVDIAIVQDKGGESFDLLELQHDLARVFASDQIDVTNLTRADPLLLYAVTHYGRLISGTKGNFQTLQKKAFHRYHDYLPYLEMEKTFVQDQLQQYVSA